MLPSVPSEANQLFNISRNTINLWFQYKAQTGDVQAKPRQEFNKGQKITDWEKFRAFANEQSDKTHFREGFSPRFMQLKCSLA
ncbi:hypothetical protein [Nostoc sp.]|uniref:hypothetical protein n=1 Tax=Nostoc sp. TaxID=1180 RepID=UPI002FF6EA39